MRDVGISPARTRILLALAVVAVVSGSAFAASEADLLGEGVELRRRGKDAEALEKFQQAHQISGSPRAKAQMGFAEQALGRWVPAYEHLQASLQATADPWIGKNR